MSEPAASTSVRTPRDFEAKLPSRIAAASEPSSPSMRVKPPSGSRFSEYSVPLQVIPNSLGGWPKPRCR